MNKHALLFLALICFTSMLSSKNRTVAQAAQLAGEFRNNPVNTMEKAPATTSSALKLAYSSMKKVKSIENGAYYYVFNKGNENGYIIISGDDRTKTILGYTDEGHFDTTSIPENLKYWLSFYETEMKSLPDSSIKTTTIILSKVKNSSTSTLSAVAPLLGNIQWNQLAPYNNQCPVINDTTAELAVSGCVATGMAQVMKYYNWPVQGKGSNSYTTTTHKIAQSVNFSKTQYDWSNMTGTYSSSSTAAQNNAVATLMHHCGVAVSMDYGESSSASVTNMALALKNNFGYDSNLQLYSRDYYTRSEWTNLLTTELNASRPILYSGQADEGGHLFVCDGYDSNGLFHFNWGWGGMSNGYFEISALDPNEQGIGSSTGGYNSYQTITTGVQKPGAPTTQVYLIYTDKGLTSSKTSVTRLTSFTAIGSDIYNRGVNVFNGYIGLGLYDNNGLVSVIKSYTVNSLGTYSGWSTFNFASSVPAGIANGNYKLYLVYKSSTDANWKIIRGKVGTANYLNIGVGTSTVTISSPAASSAILNLNSLTITGNLYQNKTGRFNINVTNTGNEYNSLLGIYLQSTSDTTIYQLVSKEPINIASGETRSLDFTGTVTVAPGEYSVTAAYDPQNDYENCNDLSTLGTALIKNILATPTGNPVLTLSNIISFPNSVSVNVSNAVLSATIKNTSGFFDDNIIAFIFPKAGGNSLTYIGYQKAIFDINEEKTLTFSGPINLAPGQYQVAVYYINQNYTWSGFTPSSFSKIPFTLQDNVATTVNPTAISGCEVYPNPVVDNLHLKAGINVKRIIIADLLGKQIKSIIPEDNNEMSVSVAGLSSGVYIYRLETENGLLTGKFIKR